MKSLKANLLLIICSILVVSCGGDDETPNQEQLRSHPLAEAAIEEIEKRDADIKQLASRLDQMQAQIDLKSANSTNTEVANGDLIIDQPSEVIITDTNTDSNSEVTEPPIIEDVETETSTTSDTDSSFDEIDEPTILSN